MAEPGIPKDIKSEQDIKSEEPPPPITENATANSDLPPPSPLANPPQVSAADDDSDPDIDDLDDVLDQFTAAQSAPSHSKPTPQASGPGRPAEKEPTLDNDIPIPQGKAPDETEEQFLARLSTEMSAVISKMADEPAASVATTEDLATMGKQLEQFTYDMENSGISPEQLLQSLLGKDLGREVSESAKDERDRRESESKSKSPDAGKKAAPASFEDTIRRTMERMEDSSTKASNATAQSSSEEDMLAEMLRALDAEGGIDGVEGGGDLSKMFLGMMEQLTNKDMLYEPMAELNTKFPDWLAANKTKLKSDDLARYSRQRDIVKDIVTKFEDKAYSDEDPKCREFIWEKMQKMQEEGAPPEDLISNPFPGMGMPGLGGSGPEEGCPTQ